jgi:hypothetical protein
MQRELSIFNESDGTLYSPACTEYTPSNGKIGEAAKKVKTAVVEYFKDKWLTADTYQKFKKNQFSVVDTETNRSIGGFIEKGTLLIKKECPADPNFMKGAEFDGINKYQKERVKEMKLDIIDNNKQVVFGMNQPGTLYLFPRNKMPKAK